MSKSSNPTISQDVAPASLLPDENPTAATSEVAGLVDSHAHLSFPEFDHDRNHVLKSAWDAGLSSIVLIGAGRAMEGNAPALELAQSDARLFSSVGVHPHDADGWGAAWEAQAEKLFTDPKVVAVGEAGLDYHYDYATPANQRACFAAQLKLAHRCDRPVIVHDREAHADVLSVLDEVGVPSAGGVMHCFSGDVAFAREVIKRGLYISIPGVVTFKNAQTLHEVVRDIPVEHLLIETDCPYLAPVPHRGKRNEPAFVVEVARAIAAIKSLSVADVARVTGRNARRLFGIIEQQDAAIAYEIRDACYLNVTNRCRLACCFCPKQTSFEVKGHNLKLGDEPSADALVAAVGDVAKYAEIVFCGYGEPTSRVEVVLEVAERLREKGARRLRLNTDGLAGLVSGLEVVKKLVEVIDSFSVSMNAPDAKAHARLCPSKYGEAAFAAMAEFVRTVKGAGREVVVSVVALPGLDIAACEALAQSWGVPLRVREYMNIG